MATLITGASAGLGEGFARAVAARGDDLILTARRVDRLEALATDLRAAHGVKVHVFAADLADHAAPRRLAADIAAAGLIVDTLINNAGFGTRGAFADAEIGTQTGQIDVNCRALVALTHALLPAMVARRSGANRAQIGRKSGAILNIASVAAFQPGPWMAVYYATKAFVLSFSEALHEEVKGSGIRVTALCPGPTRTEFADVAGMGDSELFKRFASDPQAVIRDGLAALKAGQAVKVSGLMNTLMADGIRFIPRVFARRIAGALQKVRG